MICLTMSSIKLLLVNDTFVSSPEEHSARNDNADTGQTDGDPGTSSNGHTHHELPV